MKVDETHWWNFDDDLSESSLVECPTCKEFLPLADWTETDVYCEDCGEHIGMRCPGCRDCFDHVWHKDTFRVRNPDDLEPDH